LNPTAHHLTITCVRAYGYHVANAERIDSSNQMRLQALRSVLDLLAPDLYHMVSLPNLVLPADLQVPARPISHGVLLPDLVLPADLQVPA